jgi:TRAP-type mannitol/chloroaromatic compound transport system permease small subunit
MRAKKSMIVLALILLIFNGCGEKIKYVYIKTPCPKLQTYEVNTTPQKHFKINYTVKEINE